MISNMISNSSVMNRTVTAIYKNFWPFEMLLLVLVILGAGRTLGSEYPDRECCDSAPPPPPNYHTVTPFPTPRQTTPKGAIRGKYISIKCFFVLSLCKQRNLDNLAHFQRACTYFSSKHLKLSVFTRYINL